jgi:hypothetical protein
MVPSTASPTDEPTCRVHRQPGETDVERRPSLDVLEEKGDVEHDAGEGKTGRDSPRVTLGVPGEAIRSEVVRLREWR